jgi:hypothetical protein
MPPPLLVVKDWLRSVAPVTAVVDTRISHRLPGTFPSIRLTDVGVASRSPEEALHRVQIECWGDDYDVTEDLALEIERHIPEARGAWPNGYCAGGSVDVGPFSSPDQKTGRQRHLLEVVLWLYPTP